MLLKEEFESNMNYVKPSISSMIIAAQGECLLCFFNIQIGTLKSKKDELYY